MAVRLLREELQVLQEPGSYVGEVVKIMGKTKVLVKVQPEGKYGSSALVSNEGVPLMGRRSGEFLPGHLNRFPYTQSARRPPIRLIPPSFDLAKQDRPSCILDDGGESSGLDIRDGWRSR